MKRVFALLLLAALPLSAFPKLGEAAPELPEKGWFNGPRVKVADCKSQGMLILYFWRMSGTDVRNIPVLMRQVRSLRPKGVRFAAVGIGEEKKLRETPFNNRMDFPQLADPGKKAVKLYLRPEIQLPLAVIIDSEGRLMWRGPVEKVSRNAAKIQLKKFDLAAEQRKEDFYAAFYAKINRNDYEGALKVIDHELESKPVNPVELTALQVGLLLRQFGSRERALQAVHRVQSLFPGKIAFYEMELKLIDQDPSKDRSAEFYHRLIRLYGNSPRELLTFVRYELDRPCAKMRPECAYTVARAAYHAPKFRDKRERGICAFYYAQALYCCGRPDLALKMADEAVKLLGKQPPAKSAGEMAAFYRKVVKLSPAIRE